MAIARPFVLRVLRALKRSKLNKNLDTRLAHNTLNKEQPNYSWQYLTVSVLLVVEPINDKIEIL